ncbi:MAG: hypothetical protein PHI14_00480 [Bacteroidales bacterium]|nr:hypothetical protein [Bacteroidales bacterium]
MKKETMIQLVIFIITFVEVLLLILLPYCGDFLKFFRVEGANWWGIILLINGFVLTTILQRSFKDKIKSSNILLWIIVGALIFILPYSLIRLPHTILGVANTINILIGIISSYLFFKTHSKTNKSIVIIITIAYSISYIVFLHNALLL